MMSLLIFSSRVLARFSFWLSTVVVLCTLPLQRLDTDSIARLSYALLMCSDHPRAASQFSRLLRRNRHASSQLQLSLSGMAQRLGRFSLAALLYRRAEVQPAPSLHLAAARVLGSVTQGVLDGSLSRRLASSLDALDLPPSSPDLTQHGFIVLVPVSRAYSDLFDLWLQQARQHLSGRIVVLALDAATKERLTQRSSATDSADSVLDLSSFFVFTPEGRMHDHCKSNLWILRVLLLRQLASRGHFILSLDLDAIVLDDLFALLQSLPPADIVAQVDHSIPVDVARQLGFILCCGFMFLRPTAATLAFLDLYADQTFRELDDQLALNHHLARGKVTHLLRTASYLAFQSGGVRWLCPDPSLVSRDLAYGRVIRHFQQQGQTIAELRASLGISIP